MNSPARIEELREARGDVPADSPRDKPIGAILLEAGLITLEDAERIAVHARIKRLRFGEAAVALGKLSEEGLRQALAFQFDYPVVHPESTVISREVVAAFESNHPILDDLRTLRNQVLLRWLSAQSQHNRAVAVMSPDRGDGRSFLAANLAVTFSQMGQRTLLIDADMRNARQHQLFGVQNQAGLSTILSQRTTGNFFRRVEGLRDLSVIGCGGTPPNPVDLLAKDGFGQLLEGFAKVYDVIVVDTPPGECPEAEMIAARTRGCVLVARQGVSRFSRLQQLAINVKAAGGTVVGSVLMKA